MLSQDVGINFVNNKIQKRIFGIKTADEAVES